jgi:MYXO-CTERM domain-containing protein
MVFREECAVACVPDGGGGEALCDGDNDGYAAEDCDDGRVEIHPGATETCGDGIDQDCDGVDARCAPAPGAPEGGSGRGMGSESGTGGSGSEGAMGADSGSDPASPPGSDTPAGGGEGRLQRPTTLSGGCSVRSGTASGGSMLWAGLVLTALRLRRRR